MSHGSDHHHVECLALSPKQFDKECLLVVFFTLISTTGTPEFGAQTQFSLKILFKLISSKRVLVNTLSVLVYKAQLSWAKDQERHLHMHPLRLHAWATVETLLTHSINWPLARMHVESEEWCPITMHVRNRAIRIV